MLRNSSPSAHTACRETRSDTGVAVCPGRSRRGRQTQGWTQGRGNDNDADEVDGIESGTHITSLSNSFTDVQLKLTTRLNTHLQAQNSPIPQIFSIIVC